MLTVRRVLRLTIFGLGWNFQENAYSFPIKSLDDYTPARQVPFCTLQGLSTAAVVEISPLPPTV